MCGLTSVPSPCGAPGSFLSVRLGLGGTEAETPSPWSLALWSLRITSKCPSQGSAWRTRTVGQGQLGLTKGTRGHQSWEDLLSPGGPLPHTRGSTPRVSGALRPTGRRPLPMTPASVHSERLSHSWRRPYNPTKPSRCAVLSYGRCTCAGCVFARASVQVRGDVRGAGRPCLLRLVPG